MFGNNVRPTLKAETRTNTNGAKYYVGIESVKGEHFQLLFDIFQLLTIHINKSTPKYTHTHTHTRKQKRINTFIHTQNRDL